MRFHAATVQTRCTTPLGEVALAATPHGLAGLWFTDQRWRPVLLDGAGAWPRDDAHPLLRDTVVRLQRYFAGERDSFAALPLDLQGGTAFQQAVWRSLAELPHGSTLSYGSLAARMGVPAAVRAVGAAIGRNPVSVVLPCHRVVGAQGALTGYAGGLDRKRALLRLEGADGTATAPAASACIAD